MGELLRKTGRWILDLLFPRKCIFCQRILSFYEEHVCTDCQLELPICHGEERTIANAARCVSVLRYERNVRQSILRYKFERREFYSLYYAQLLEACFTAKFAGSVDLITWVPVSRRRLRKRGFDQSKVMAKRLAKRCNMPCMAALMKIADNPAQSRMSSAEQRRRNVSGAYRACKPEAWAGKSILLVDDVLTTGATLTECCAVLKAAGAKHVSCLTLAATSQMRT